MRKWIMIPAVAALVLGATAFAACGGDDDDDDETPTSTATQDGGTADAGNGGGGDGPAIDQDDLAFKPDELTVSVGETITFTNSESALHTVTINGVDESGNMREGDVFEWTPEEAGEYEITCEYHPQMNATITVE